MPMTMFTWQRTLDDLKRKALAQTDEEPQITEEAKAVASDIQNKYVAAAMQQIRAAARAGVQAGLKPGAECVVRGWFVILSRTRGANGVYFWHLSASLFPKGRPSALQDWKVLGLMVARLGGPPEAIIVPENPNDVHHWRWNEQ